MDAGAGVTLAVGEIGIVAGKAKLTVIWLIARVSLTIGDIAIHLTLTIRKSVACLTNLTVIRGGARSN